MQVLDLFSGIGGFSYGLEIADRRFETVAFCEKDEYARRVLRKNWPDVPIFEDVKELSGDEFSGIDVLCGGVPCQPYSFAGKQGGDGDDRDLLPEMLRLIEVVGPRWVIVENVRGFVSMPMGLDRCISEMENLGYGVQAFLAGAVGVDARHRRERCWVVGHRLEAVADSEVVDQRPGLRPDEPEGIGRGRSGDGGGEGETGEPESSMGMLADGLSLWMDEPDIPRVAHGIENRVDRLRCLGNAVVPQVVANIGRAIIEAERKD